MERSEASVQTRQNTSALRKTTSPPSLEHQHQHQKQEQSADGRFNQTNGTPEGMSMRDKVELIRDLSTQMDLLRQEHARHAQDIRTLEARVDESEVICGRMLRTYLELGRAIELKKKHIRDDKMSLAYTQGLKDDTSKRLDATLTRISSLAHAPDNASDPA